MFQLSLHRQGGDYSADVVLPWKEAELWWQRAGLSYPATGYGNKIPTRYMVRFANKWRRVYVAVWSNVGTCYIGNLKDGLIIY